MAPEVSTSSPEPQGPWRQRRNQGEPRDLASDREIQEAVDFLIEALTRPDEVLQAAAARGMPGLPTPLSRLVTNRLRALVDNGDEVLLSQVSDGLVSLGKPAISLLCCQLLTADSVPLQVALIRILAAVGEALDEPERLPGPFTIIGPWTGSEEQAVQEAGVDARGRLQPK
jgi:hypothetical protein